MTEANQGLGSGAWNANTRAGRAKKPTCVATVTPIATTVTTTLATFTASITTFATTVTTTLAAFTISIATFTTTVAAILAALAPEVQVVLELVADLIRVVVSVRHDCLLTAGTLLAANIILLDVDPSWSCDRNNTDS